MSLNALLSWIMKLILLGCIIYNFLIPNILFSVASFFALLLSLAPQFLHRNFRITFPWEIDLLITFALVMHIFFGELLDFHRTVFMFDKVMHIFGTGIICILGFMWIYAIHFLTPVNLTLPLMALFTFMFSMAVGAFWEIAEFAVDQIWTKTSQNGLEDTMWDLIYDSVGGIIVACGMVLYVKYLEERSRAKFHKSIREAFHIKLSRH